MPNSLFTINAYRKHHMWMFDDESRDIKEEPFVFGADLMLDYASGSVKPDGSLDESKDECTIVFSATPMPKNDIHIRLYEPDGMDGHFYEVVKFDQWQEGEGFQFWLCPALLAFFDKAPENIYVKIQGQ